MNKQKVILLLLLVVPVLSSRLEGAYNSSINRGNRYFEKGEYGTALKKYNDAEIDRPGSPVTRYNRGNTFYQQGDFEKAASELTGALSFKDPLQKKQAHYNLGNAFFRMNDFGRAVDQYKKALKIDPEDRDVKYNLETAIKRIREQKQGGSRKKEEKDKKQQKEEKDRKEKEKEDKNSDKNKEKKTGQKPGDNREKTPENRMSREDAQRILDALRDEEKKTQKKVRPKSGSGPFIEKDW